MRTLKLTLAYDGTRLVGWQRQADGESVQGLLEEALARFEGAAVTVHGAGRTDAGVHALGQVASVRLTCGHDTTTLVRALNAHLPRDVRVLAAADVAPDFHARFSARSKAYRYLVRNGPMASPFERAYVWHVPHGLDVARMQRAAGLFVGTHDFGAFQSVGSDSPDSTRTVFTSSLTSCEAPWLLDGAALLAYEISGSGFLRHMVRAIMGTLVEVGRGWREPAQMIELLRAGQRADAGATAPPHGLFLARVDYD